MRVIYTLRKRAEKELQQLVDLIQQVIVVWTRWQVDSRKSRRPGIHNLDS
jgi:hypothetical protein